jgi:hypothetical protein
MGLLELVTRGGIGVLPPQLSDDEARAVASSSRGYPCSAYYVDGEESDPRSTPSSFPPFQVIIIQKCPMLAQQDPPQFTTILT